MKPGEILFLNRNEVAQFITPAEVLELTEKALVEFSLGNAINPSKLILPTNPYHNGHINSMPSYMQYGDVAGVKVVSVYNDNKKKYGLPTTIGTIILYDPETGMPKCIMDGTYITDQRTGAVSGVNAKYLARNNSETLAIIGAGVTGYTSMQMILMALPGIKEVVVCNRTASRRDAFIEKAQAAYPDMKFRGIEDHKVALQECDIVVYATTGDIPLVQYGEPAEGVTVITVCEFLTKKAIWHFDHWFADFAECAIERYNDGGRMGAEILGFEWEDFDLDDISGEIGDVITGKLPGRTDDKEKILAGAVGISVEDVICAEHVFKKAMEAGAGIILDLQNL
ncbi:MAG: ornithine cyclodeaminase family protein [Firmicutes bacterium]|nr:ornithine cyclodeaminase family protein [Bacillota bacterium]